MGQAARGVLFRPLGPWILGSIVFTVNWNAKGWDVMDWPRPEGLLAFSLVWLAIAHFQALRREARDWGIDGLRAPVCAFFVFLALGAVEGLHVLHVSLFAEASETAWPAVILSTQVLLFCPLLGVLDAVAFTRARAEAGQLERVFA
jgi:hypothetical protein